jgi:hypothetical protein
MIDDTKSAFCRRRMLRVSGAAALAWPAVAVAGEAAPIRFGCDLSADEQSAPTDSPGKGHADFVLERETLKFSWVITYSGTTSPVTAVRIHGPQLIGTNAGMLIDVGAQGVASPIRGAANLDNGLLQFLLSGRMYVNVVTTKYKDGELRGQIKRLRSAPAP